MGKGSGETRRNRFLCVCALPEVLRMLARLSPFSVFISLIFTVRSLQSFISSISYIQCFPGRVQWTLKTADPLFIGLQFPHLNSNKGWIERRGSRRPQNQRRRRTRVIKVGLLLFRSGRALLQTATGCHYPPSSEEDGAATNGPRSTDRRRKIPSIRHQETRKIRLVPPEGD